MKRRLLLVLTAVVLCSLAVYFIINNKTSSPKPSSIPRLDQDIPTEWFTYVHPSYHYTLEIPKGWEYEDRTEDYYAGGGRSGLLQRLYIQSPFGDSYYTGGDFGTFIWHRGYDINFTPHTWYTTISQIINESEKNCSEVNKVIYGQREFIICTHGSNKLTAYTLGNLAGISQPVTFEIDFNAGDEEILLEELMKQFNEALKF